jgi:hypothetical protein
MKKIYFTTICGAAILLFTACSRNGQEEVVKIDPVEPMSQANSANNIQLASAGGQATLFLAHLNGEVQHFWFHVQKDANGNVSGSWETKSPGQDLRTHGILNCLTFIDDHTVFITGIVTKKIGGLDYPGQYEVGMPVWFKVKDNGEGNQSDADEFTDYYSLDGIECVNYEQASLHPIISGNIQVRRQ